MRSAGRSETELFWYYKMQFDTGLGLRAFFRLDYGFLLDPDIFGPRRQFMKQFGHLSDALAQIKEGVQVVSDHGFGACGLDLGSAHGGYRFFNFFLRRHIANSLLERVR